MSRMQKISPFLWFDANAEEAVNHYISIFEGSRIVTLSRYGDTGPGRKGQVMVVEFELAGQRFLALNGGSHFKFTEAISLLVYCETQQEIDELWSKLTAGGGQEVECGWLKDKFGLSWQVVPEVFFKMMQDPDPQKTDRVMRAMMQMKKMDIAGLQRAYDGA